MKIGQLNVSLEYASIDRGATTSPTAGKLTNFSRKFTGYMHSFISTLRERREAREMDGSGGGFHSQRKFDFKKHLKSILIASVVVILIVIAGKSLFNIGGTDATATPEVKPAKATLNVNKEFSFPLNTAEGEKVADVKFMIENAELRDDIIVNGSRATSIKGRQFLILTVKISNEYRSSIQIDTRDYVRLSVNGADEWLAPDIHNDPVEVQAISTKYTRLGFAINEKDQNIAIRIGEINGYKELIPLQF